MFPEVNRNWEGIVALVLGIVMLGGVGTIIAGIRDGRNVARDVVIGILQLIIPIAGNIWGLIWGVMIFVKSK